MQKIGKLGRLAVFIFTLAGPSGCVTRPSPLDVYTQPQRLVALPDGRRINLYCTGNPAHPGDPTVILESGLGFPSLSWRRVQPPLSRRARTCSYDRAGLGFSDPGPLPRDPERIVADLSALLAAAKINPPYLVVGSSYGGHIVRVFAERNPGRIAGLVLVDPFVPGQTRVLDAIAPRTSEEVAQAVVRERECVSLIESRALTFDQAVERDCISAPDAEFPPSLQAVRRAQRLSPASARAAYSEAEALDALDDFEASPSMSPLGRVPVIVLTAGQAFASDDYTPDQQARLLAAWRSLHRSVAARSVTGEERLAPAAGHVIQTSQPETVIEAVDDLLRASRRRAAESSEPVEAVTAKP